MSEINWRDIPSLSALRAFEATARLGGFSVAGKSLNVTHAAIAQRVRELEKDLGVSLVVRAGRGLALTPQGTKLFEDLNDGFSLINQSIDRIRRGEKNRGIRVTCTPALSYAFIIPRLGEFWNQYPNIPVSLNPTSCTEDLKYSNFDVAVRTGSGRWPDVDMQALWESPVILIAGAPLLEKHGGKVADIPLDKVTWIRPEKDSDDPQMMRGIGIDPDQCPVMHIDGQADSIQAVMRGIGVTFVSKVVVSDDLNSGALVEIPVKTQEKFNYFTLTPKGVNREDAKRFVEWLRSLAPNYLVDA